MSHKNSLEYAHLMLQQAVHANNRAMRVLEMHPLSINANDPKAQLRLARMSLKAARSYTEDALKHFKVAEDVLEDEMHGKDD